MSKITYFDSAFQNMVNSYLDRQEVLLLDAWNRSAYNTGSAFSARNRANLGPARPVLDSLPQFRAPRGGIQFHRAAWEPCEPVECSPRHDYWVTATNHYREFPGHGVIVLTQRQYELLPDAMTTINDWIDASQQ